MSKFSYGQLPITITQPTWLRGKYRATVSVGSDHFSRDGRTPERAALWLNISLPAFFEYADSLKGTKPRAKNYKEAEKLSRAMLRANVRKAARCRKLNGGSGSRSSGVSANTIGPPELCVS